MKTRILNGKEFKCPEGWPDVTMEQLLKLNTGPTRSTEIIAICTGIEESEWRNSTNFVLVEEIEHTLAFVVDTSGAFAEQEPKDFVFNGVTVPPFSDIGIHSIGQYQDLKLEIAMFEKDEGEEINIIRRLSIYPNIVAIYLQPLITGGDYDCDKADLISKELLKYSAMEVSAWGRFFIKKFHELRIGILKDVSILVTSPKKTKQGFLAYLKTLVLQRFSTR